MYTILQEEKNIEGVVRLHTASNVRKWLLMTCHQIKKR